MASDEPAAGFHNLRDLESAARPKVIDPVWGYVSGGAGVEATMAANRAAFARRAIRPRALAAVREVDLSTSLLGHRVQAPFYISPTAYQGFLFPEGEAATARAAAKAGVLFALSTLSTCSLEEVAEASGNGPRWFQLYLQPDPAQDEVLLRRAEKAGFTAIILTADVPVLGIRDQQAQGGFAIDTDIPLGNGEEFHTPPRGPTVDGERLVVPPHACVTPEAIERIRRLTHLPVLVKGILTGDDAELAVEHGAQAVIVSNHGGRQLDGAPAALDALPEVVRAVGGKVDVYVDSGFRRGSDVLMALALGAKGVGLGRPVLWALAAGGEAGVAHLLTLLRQELANVMILAGRPRLRDLEPGMVVPR